MAAEYEVNIKINTQQIERELKKVDKAVNNIGKGRGGKKQPILALPSTEMLNATARKIQSLDKVNRKIALRQREINKQTRDQALNIDTLVKTQEKRARLLNKINEMEAKGLNVSRLRKQLAKATTEQSNRRFGSAEKEFRVLEKSIRLEQSKLRILKEQRKGFASSPVLGTRTMMGSPAQIAAAARAGGATSPIRGGLNFPGSPAFLAGATASRTPFGPSFPTGGASSPVRGGFNFPGSPIALAGATVSNVPFGPSFPTGGAALPIRGGISMPGSPIAVQAAKATNLRAVKVEASWARALGELQETAKMLEIKDTNIKQSWTTALTELNETAALIRVRSQQANAGLTGQSSPVGGATDIPGSPAFLRRQRRNERLEQVGLGAGFPLLFGGGAGSIIGGAVGGLSGSFGAQIAFSAIGQQVDQFVASMVNAGKALTSVGGAADFMAEKSLFSSDSMQFRIEKLIEEGNVTEAAALMTQEMAKQVGGTGLKALQDLGTEANKMGKLFSALILQVQAFISRALTPLLAAINKVVGGVVLNNQFNTLMNEATGDRAREIKEFLKPFTREVSGQGGQATKSIISEEGKRLAVEKFGGQFIPEGAAIKPTGLELLQAADKPNRNAEKLAREEQRLQGRLAKLDQERQKVIEISRFKDQIAAAEAAGDQQLVIRLEGEQRIAEIEARRKEDLIGVTDQREIEAINIGKATEKLAAHREVERELEELQRQRQEKFDDTIENLQFQLDIAQATSEAERERLRIEKEMKKLKEDGMSEEQAAQVGSLMKQISAENSPLNKFIKQSVESLNDLETQAVQIAQGIGNAIGNSLVGGIQNLVTGAATVKEVFADMLKSVADVLAKQAAQMIATYIAIGIARKFAGLLGGGGDASDGLNIDGIQQYTNEFNAGDFVGAFGNANGGPVTGGSPMIVGERGPELFVPFANGEITSSESLGAEMANAMAVPFVPGGNQGGTTSQLINRQENTQINRQENLRQLSVPFSRSSEASMVAAAEQQTAEAISNPSPLDVRFESQSINGVEYVTAEQHQSGMAQAAQRGRALTLAALQNSVKARRRVGL